jgi:hypothetical protein
VLGPEDAERLSADTDLVQCRRRVVPGDESNGDRPRGADLALEEKRFRDLDDELRLACFRRSERDGEQADHREHS